MWQIQLLFLILGYFLSLYSPNSLKNQNFEKMKKLREMSLFYICVPKMMIRWCTVPEICCMMNVIIFHFGPFFALLPPNSPKNQNLKKMKKAPGDITILHMCNKNYDQMMYGSWDMVQNRCNYFTFWVIFCPFTPLTAQKIKT